VLFRRRRIIARMQGRKSSMIAELTKACADHALSKPRLCIILRGWEADSC
jgi:hypothetical protein